MNGRTENRKKSTDLNNYARHGDDGGVKRRLQREKEKNTNRSDPKWCTKEKETLGGRARKDWVKSNMEMVLEPGENQYIWR